MVYIICHLVHIYMYIYVCMVYDMQRCSTWGIQSWEDGDEAQKLVGQHGAAHIQSNAPFATKDWMR